MKLLLDTQILLWAAGQPERLSAAARKLLNDSKNELLFSAASLWEIAIKRTLGRTDFRVEPRLLRRGLLDNGYIELVVTSRHAVSIDGLPARHRDPFDRLLLAQAITEGITLLTGDVQLARYRGPGGCSSRGWSFELARASRGCPVSELVTAGLESLESRLAPRAGAGRRVALVRRAGNPVVGRNGRASAGAVDAGFGRASVVVVAVAGDLAGGWLRFALARGLGVRDSGRAERKHKREDHGFEHDRSSPSRPAHRTAKRFRATRNYVGRTHLVQSPNRSSSLSWPENTRR